MHQRNKYTPWWSWSWADRCMCLSWSTSSRDSDVEDDATSGLMDGWIHTSWGNEKKNDMLLHRQKNMNWLKPLNHDEKKPQKHAIPAHQWAVLNACSFPRARTEAQFWLNEYGWSEWTKRSHWMTEREEGKETRTTTDTAKAKKAKNATDEKLDRETCLVDRI